MADAALRAYRADDKDEDGELTLDNRVGGLLEAESKAALRALAERPVLSLGGE